MANRLGWQPEWADFDFLDILFSEKEDMDNFFLGVFAGVAVPPQTFSLHVFIHELHKGHWWDPHSRLQPVRRQL